LTTPSTVTADPLAELEKLAAMERAATSPPWTLEADTSEGDTFPWAIRTPEPHIMRPEGESYKDSDYVHGELAELLIADMEFIVAARSAMPRLIAMGDALLKLHTRSEKPRTTVSTCLAHSYSRTAGFDHLAVERCPDCIVTQKHVCTHCRHECPDNDEWPCPTYSALAAALSGEEVPSS
jgi:hypothetical protein